MDDANPDPIVHRPTPNPALVHRAFNLMLEAERGNQGHARVRQQWDTAFGAIKVAMDALRDIWPADAAEMGSRQSASLCNAMRSIEDAYAELDDIAVEMVGGLMVAVQRGEITTEEEFEAYLEAQHDD